MNLECHSLDDYYDDLMSPADRERFCDHLASCADCQFEFDSRKELDSVLKQAWGAVVVNDREPAVVEEFPSTESRWRIYALAASVLVLITAGAWLLLESLALPSNQAIVVSAPKTFDSDSPPRQTKGDLPESEHSSSAPRITSAESALASPIEVVYLNGPMTDAVYQTTFASVKCEGDEQAQKIATNREFTVYRITQSSHSTIPENN